ncbi:hypothetical protein RJ641_020187, partial [Dillenia turbinata]
KNVSSSSARTICSLEDWLENLLSDIDLSRSAPLATFLELEAAARSCRSLLTPFDDPNVKYSDVYLSPSIEPLSSDIHLNSDVSLTVSSAIASDSEIGTTNEDSEIGTPRCRRDLVSENLMSEQDINSQETSLNYGISMNEFTRNKRKLRSERDNKVIGRENLREDKPKDAAHFIVGSRLASELESQKLTSHVRRLSADSIASDVSSMKASEISNFGDANSLADAIETTRGAEVSRSCDAVDGSGFQFPGRLVLAHPSDERQRIGRVLTTIQRRLVTAKTDMEDLLSKLNQELAVKQYPTMKYKGYDVYFNFIVLDFEQCHLFRMNHIAVKQESKQVISFVCTKKETRLQNETYKERKQPKERWKKCIEKLYTMAESVKRRFPVDKLNNYMFPFCTRIWKWNLKLLNTAARKLCSNVLLERERFTQMQWDVEELRRKCLEVEWKLKSELDERARAELAKESIVQENEKLLQELDVSREQYENLHKHEEEEEAKSKADVNLLVKVVKSLRTSQSELKQELSRLTTEKIELEELANTANEKLLHESEILRNRLQECSVNFLIEEEDNIRCLRFIDQSDNRIGLLLAEDNLVVENTIGFHTPSRSGVLHLSGKRSRNGLGLEQLVPSPAPPSTQDVENAVAAGDGQGGKRSADDGICKLLNDVFVDNATLRKLCPQHNS